LTTDPNQWLKVVSNRDTPLTVEVIVCETVTVGAVAVEVSVVVSVGAEEVLDTTNDVTENGWNPDAAR
jgi:hypothetical protein